MAKVTHGHGIAAIIFGIFELILGIVIIACGFAAASKYSNTLYSPYWAGFVYLVPGILGIVTGGTKNNGCMIGFMILNIILFILLGVVGIIIFIFVAMIGTVISDITSYCHGSGNSCTCTYKGQSYPINTSCSNLSALTAAMWGSAIALLLSALVTLASSILGCVSACCTPSDPVPGLVVQQHYPAGFAQPPMYQPSDQKTGPV